MRLLRLYIEKGDRRHILDGFDQTFPAFRKDEKQISPLVFVGLNGSGKSQLMEAITDIFYYLNNYFRKVDPIRKKTNLRFEVEYLITDQSRVRHIKISCLSDKLVIYENIDSSVVELTESEQVLKVLPRRIVGYTSGENESLSLRFLDLISEYEKYVSKAIRSGSDPDNEIPESRFLLINYSSNINILVANFLFRSRSELKPFREYANINFVESFRITIQLRRSTAPRDIKLTDELAGIIDSIRKCATCYVYDPDKNSYTFDFWVNNETSRAFQKYFKSAIELYLAFGKLELLNNLVIKKEHREEVKRVRENLRQVVKLPEPAESDKVFKFELVRLSLLKPRNTIDYIQLSDGEHQFIEVFGSVMMLNDENVLYLFDEPETHFNPHWRVEFIKLLNSICKKGSQEFLISTHSPFILSDTRSDNIFIFSKDEKNVITANNPKEETYGASFDKLVSLCFDVRPPIAKQSLEKLQDLQSNGSLKEIESSLNGFGDSIEKFYLIQRMEDLKETARKRKKKK